MSVTISQVISNLRLGRVYVPPLTALYLYSIDPRQEFIWLVAIGMIAAVSAHGYNRAVYGTGAQYTDRLSDEEEFRRKLIVVFKHGNFSGYPKNIFDLISNPNKLKFNISRIPALIFTLIGALGINIVAILSLFYAYPLRSRLDFVGLGLIFAIIIFYAQAIIWPSFWSVSNERDNKNPAVDAPDYNRIQEYQTELNEKEHLKIKESRIDFTSGGICTLKCEIADSEPSTVDSGIQLIAFSFAGLVEATDRPITELNVQIETPDDVCHQFSVSRDLVSRFASGEMNREEYMQPIFSQIEHRIDTS